MRSYILCIITLPFLSACYKPIPGARGPSDSERSHIAHAFHTWQLDESLPSAEKCEGAIDDVRVFMATENAEVENLCGACRPGLCSAGLCDLCVSACLISESVGPWYDYETRPLIVYWHDTDRREAVMHEMGHYLSWCAGLSLQQLHDDPRVWGAGGWLDTALGR